VLTLTLPLVVVEYELDDELGLVVLVDTYSAVVP